MNGITTSLIEIVFELKSMNDLVFDINSDPIMPSKNLWNFSSWYFWSGIFGPRRLIFPFLLMVCVPNRFFTVVLFVLSLMGMIPALSMFLLAPVSSSKRIFLPLILSCIRRYGRKSESGFILCRLLLCLRKNLCFLPKFLLRLFLRFPTGHGLIIPILYY